MADRVVLHIGPRKTATTYLQRALQRLVESGDIPASLYPVRTRGRLDHNQVPGLIDLARSLGEIALQEDAWQQQDGSYAEALRTHVRETSGTVILSAEALSVMRESGAQSIVEAFAPAPVDVIVTLRDLARILPSSWQQHVRNGNIEDYPTYMDLRVEERTSGDYLTEVGRAFWRAYRYGDLVRRWQQAARSVAIVTVPGSSSDPAEVWRRFRDAAQLGDALPDTPPHIRADVANVSLTGAETYALHGFNVAAREAGEGRRDVRAVHRHLLKQGWADRPDRDHRLGIPADFYPTVVAWAREDLADLALCTAPVFGTLDDLVVPDTLTYGIPDPESIATAAGAAIAMAWAGRRGEAEADADSAPLSPAQRDILADSTAGPVNAQRPVLDMRGMDPDD